MSFLGFDHIRFAFPHDEERLYQFLLELHRENGMFPVSEAMVRDTIRAATNRQGGVVGIIDGPDGRIEASIGMMLEQAAWYTRAVSLNEKWNFVREDCRRTSHAKDLMEFAKRCADELGVELFIGVVSTERTEAKIRLYRRQFEPVGAFFRHGRKT